MLLFCFQIDSISRYMCACCTADVKKQCDCVFRKPPENARSVHQQIVWYEEGPSQAIRLTL